MLYNIFAFFHGKKLYICSMAGIYVHIPFCKTRCIYCGFFSTTSLSMRDAYVDAVCEELGRRSNYLKGEDVKTIYFGGGTPSQLSVEQIGKILGAIYNIYNVHARAEITLEGNPDDMTPEFLAQIRSLGINRLSMGVQSFDDERLHFLHRRHSASQARTAVEDAIRSGFENISIDLMFGFPKQTLEQWKADVKEAIALPVRHISAYSLMYDEGTVLSTMLDRGDITEIDEELSLEMYKFLVDELKKAGFEHYEISNFCRPGYCSRHNSSYWHGIPYLGVGAGAHSYDGTTRQYNVDSLTDYLCGAEPEVEQLSISELYNEFVFTGLRTSEGISLRELEEKFGKEYYDSCLNSSKKHIDNSTLEIKTNEVGEKVLRLTSSGVFISNDIMSDLMIVD